MEGDEHMLNNFSIKKSKLAKAVFISAFENVVELIKLLIALALLAGLGFYSRLKWNLRFF